MINLIPRSYQNSIFETAKEKNTLVILPTGLGKTMIALLLSISRLKEHPGSKILILAPTRPLVEQHFNSFKKELPELFAELQIFTGSIQAKKREKIFQKAEIIFSTPQCIANDIEHGLYSLSEVSLIVIDEAHRCLNNYDYTKVMRFYKSQAEKIKILGLTASPGSDADKVRQICSHLDIEAIESRTRNSEDVKPYLKELEYEKILVGFPPEFLEIRALLKRIFDSAGNKLKERGFLKGAINKITLLMLQNSMIGRISRKDFSAMHAISLTAQAIKISHALELLETQTLSGLYAYLANLEKQAAENKSRAVKTLVKMPEFVLARTMTSSLIAKKIEHPKINKVFDIIKSEFSTNKNAKIIIFSQFRETASKIKEKLSELSAIKPSLFIGQAKKSSSAGLSQKEQKQIIQEFRDGSINVLCATSIGEEGLDIPEVSAVIFYEPIPSAIRKIQRAGRTARLSSGKLIVLITEDTRDEIHHYISSARERKMHKTIELIKEEIRLKPKTLDNFHLNQ